MTEESNKNAYAELHERRRATRRVMWQWGNTINDIGRLEVERESFRRWAEDARETLHAQNIDGMPHGSGNKSDLSDVVVLTIKRAELYEETAKRIDSEISDRIRLRNDISEHVAELPPEQERIISYRYVDGHNYQFIAFKTNYDERTVKRIEAKAIDYIAQFVLKE